MDWFADVLAQTFAELADELDPIIAQMSPRSHAKNTCTVSVDDVFNRDCSHCISSHDGRSLRFPRREWGIIDSGS